MSEISTNPTPSAILTLNQEVAEQIKNSGEAIKSAVKTKFVQEEVSRRTDLLARLIVAINAFRKEGYRLKADQIFYNADKSIASETWSKGQLDKKEKFYEKLAKAEKTFENALNNNEYDKVEEVISQLKASDKASDKPSGDSKKTSYDESEVVNQKP